MISDKIYDRKITLAKYIIGNVSLVDKFIVAKELTMSNNIKNVNCVIRYFMLTNLSDDSVTKLCSEYMDNKYKDYDKFIESLRADKINDIFNMTITDDMLINIKEEYAKVSKKDIKVGGYNRGYNRGRSIQILHDKYIFHKNNYITTTK